MPGYPDGYQRIRANVTLYLYTGSGSEVAVGPWDGDLQVQGIEAGNKTPVVLMDRDDYQGSVPGADAFPTWSLTIRHCGKLSDSAKRTIGDMIYKTGKVLSDGDVTTDQEGRVWHLGARIIVVGDDGTDVVTMPNCRVKYDYSSGEKNTLALTGTAYRPTGGGAPYTIT